MKKNNIAYYERKLEYRRERLDGKWEERWKINKKINHDNKNQHEIWEKERKNEKTNAQGHSSEDHEPKRFMMRRKAKKRKKKEKEKKKRAGTWRRGRRREVDDDENDDEEQEEEKNDE